MNTGGHGEWFVQDFDEAGEPTSPLASLAPAAAISRPGPALAVGSQAEALVTARGSGRALALWSDARAFGLLSAGALSATVEPLYGRAPDARLPGARPPLPAI